MNKSAGRSLLKQPGRAVLMALGLLLPALMNTSPAIAQDGNRLFLSPQLRIELERRRLGMVAPQPVVERPVEIDELAAEEETEEVIIKFGGAMFSAGTGNRLWINGRLLDEAELPQAMSLIRLDNGSSTLRVVSGREQYELKTGQVLNLSAGQLFESYEWLRIEEAAAAAAAQADPAC